MKRMMAVGAALAVIAIPAAAFGQKARTTHFGHLVGSGGSSVKFKDSTNGSGARTVTSFAVKNFEVACSDGVAGTLKIAKLSGEIKVSSSGAFKARDDNGITVFKVRGQINRNKSTGTFRYYGAIEADDGATHNCNSGRLSWVTRP